MYKKQKYKKKKNTVKMWKRYYKNMYNISEL